MQRYEPAPPASATAASALAATRAEAALDFVTRQINHVIEFIMKHGERVETQPVQYHITFKKMFTLGQTEFPSLVGSLRAAKHQHVVDFAGETLFQGASDNTLITLLRTEPVGQNKSAILSVQHEDKPPPPDPSDAEHEGEPCQSCGKPVFSRERIRPNGLTLHKSCFNCIQCSRALDMSAYACLDNHFYCVPHYKQAFRIGADYTKGFVEDHGK